MKEMIKKIREEKGGFTLAELLIVVAIVLVLVAIAVPVFTGALDKANEAVENANIHAVKSAGATQILLTSENKDLTGPWKVEADVDEHGNISNLKVTEQQADGIEEKADKQGNVYKVTAKVVATDVTTPTA